eukprot:7777939-Heterocapsa_arctica.AAC.1
MGTSSSSKDPTVAAIEVGNSFSDLEQAEQAEEVARLADQVKEVQEQMDWEPERRCVDASKRKQ